MITISSTLQNMLDSGRFSARWMVRVELDGGAQGLWGDTYSLTYGGCTYAPLGGNLEIDGIPGQAGLTSDRVNVSVSNLATAVANVIGGMDWHQRPATIYLAFINEDGTVVDVLKRFSGFLDDVDISEAAGDAARLVMSIENNNRELNRSSNETRSDSSQRRRSATDGFFKHAATANTETSIFWGRKGVQKPKLSGVAKYLDKWF